MNNYKKRLYADWQSGLYTAKQLSEKYERSIMKVIIIIENGEVKRVKQTSSV